MFFNAFPLISGKAHPFPIIQSRSIFITELHPERLIYTAFGFCDVGLKFNGIYSGICDGINIGVQNSQAAIVRLTDFGDEKGFVVVWFYGFVVFSAEELYHSKDFFKPSFTDIVEL